MIKRIRSHDTFPLRQKVLRPQQTVESCRYPLDDVEGSAHFGYFQDGKLVSIGSVYLETRSGGTERSWRLRGMATDPSCQGRGLGSEVLSACLEYVENQKGSELWCNARTTAAQFYFKHGFLNLTPMPFELPGIGPHYVMTFPIKPSNEG